MNLPPAVCLVLASVFLRAEDIVPSSPAAPVHELVGTRWLLEDIEQQGVIDNLQSTLEISAADQAVGSGGCNQYGAGLTLKEKQIRFGATRSTRMACVEAAMNQEQRFFNALPRVRTYEFKHEGAILLLLDEEGKALLRFSRMEAPDAG